MVRGTRGADAYRRMDVETRSPMELVIMLYDGALRFMGDARAAIDRNDVRARTDQLSTSRDRGHVTNGRPRRRRPRVGKPG